MRAGRRPLNRRTLFTAVFAAGTTLALGACSENDELADQAGSDQGYVSGSGVVSQVAVEDRGEPLELDFETIDGESMSLADLRPTPVVINLWYAACPPCRKEAPDLKSVSESFGDKASSSVSMCATRRPRPMPSSTTTRFRIRTCSTPTAIWSPCSRASCPRRRPPRRWCS